MKYEIISGYGYERTDRKAQNANRKLDQKEFREKMKRNSKGKRKRKTGQFMLWWHNHTS